LGGKTSRKSGDGNQRVVIVTGAGRGLGRAFAEFAADDGHAVLCADLDGEAAQATAAAISDGGGAAVGTTVDVTSAQSAAAMAAKALECWGRIDILINNAGIYGDHRFEPITETDLDYWDVVIRVNLKGPLVCSRAVIPAMRARQWGRIVNISSMGAYTPAGVYALSKLGVNHLTWNLAVEVGEDHITVNAVAPGTIDVPSAHRINSPESLADRVKQNLIKRLGTPRDIYSAIRYFISDDAEWCTAQTLLVNGGWNVRL
jgi:NAD(P)-dependent dehydrogenase (short-subunit alcohol dehydrogenase family)